jgi:hypothetical protein
MRMNRVAGFGLFLAAGLLAALALSPGSGAAPAPARNADGAAELAARAFLASLPAELRKQAAFPFDSAERTSWHFVPRERSGVSLLMLDDAQSELLGPLLGSALSPEGLLTARGVIKHENILRRIETAAGVGNASRRDPGLYYASVFGTPVAARPWSWRFEGHHLSINVTQVPGEAPVVAPIFIGANPATVPAGPDAGLRLLAAEEDLGRALVTMLGEARRKTALISDTAFPDIITGNDPKVRPLALEGLAAADMTAAEQQQLRRLIELYVNRLTPAAARDMLARLDRAGFGKVRFAWAGSIETGQKHYYRVHGPTLLIEYDNTQNDANHIHTVFRDLERDFGGDALREHLNTAHRSNP